MIKSDLDERLAKETEEERALARGAYEKILGEGADFLRYQQHAQGTGRAMAELPGSGLEPWARLTPQARPPVPKPRRLGGDARRGGPDPRAHWRAIFVAALLAALFIAIRATPQH